MIYQQGHHVIDDATIFVTYSWLLLTGKGKACIIDTIYDWYDYWQVAVWSTQMTNESLVNIKM